MTSVRIIESSLKYTSKLVNEASNKRFKESLEKAGVSIFKLPGDFVGSNNVHGEDVIVGIKGQEGESLVSESVSALQDHDNTVANQEKTKHKMNVDITDIFACPRRGWITTDRVLRLVEQHAEYQMITLVDTLGVGTVGHTRRLLDQIVTAFGKSFVQTKIVVDFHNTFGQALANIFLAVTEGRVRHIQASVSGIGATSSMRYSPHHVPTEDLVYMLNGLGYEHGIDVIKLAHAGDLILKETEQPQRSNAGGTITFWSN